MSSKKEECNLESLDKLLDLEDEMRLENVHNDEDEETALTLAQSARIEKNRQKAKARKQSKLIPHPYAKTDAGSIAKSIIRVQGSKFVDTGGGFLLEEKTGTEESEPPLQITKEPAPIIEPDQPTCLECKEQYVDSYLFQTFDHSVCDNCRDNEEKHSLITKTEAKSEYLLKDCDLEKREPVLKFVVRKNPHNVRWGDMKLYLHLQVEKRALEVWGSEEGLQEELDRREEKRGKTKLKKYNKQVKALRMTVRSSMYDRTTKASHQHDFGPDTYNEEDDNYVHTCKTCPFEETFEKM